MGVINMKVFQEVALPVTSRRRCLLLGSSDMMSVSRLLPKQDDISKQSRDVLAFESGPTVLRACKVPSSQRRLHESNL